MLFELAEPSVGGVARSERLLHLKLPSQFVDNVKELKMNWCKSGCAGFKGRVAEKRGARGVRDVSISTATRLATARYRVGRSPSRLLCAL